MVGSTLGGGRGSATGGGSVAGISRISFGKKTFSILLRSESTGTPARLSASAHVFGWPGLSQLCEAFGTGP